MSDCTKAMRSAVGDDVLTEAQATDILTRMQNLANARARERGIRYDEAIKDIAGEMAAGQEAMRVIDRRNRLLSIAAYKRQHKAIMESKSPMGKALRQALEFTDDKASALKSRFRGPVAAKLEEFGLTRDFQAQRYSKEVWEEIHNVERGGTSPVMPGETGQKIHEFLKWFSTESRAERNAMKKRYGAYFQERPDYGFRQTYSRQRLHDMGGKMDDGHKARTKKAFLDLVNSVRFHPDTLAGRDPDLFWNDVFTNMYGETHWEAATEVDVDRFNGVHGSLANRLSEGRLIHFADAESQWRWNQAIGSGDYFEALMREIDGDAKSIALMSEFGPNWKNTIETLYRDLQAEAKDREDSAKQEKDLKGLNLKGYLGVLSGEANIPTNPTASKFIQEVKSWLYLSKMGGVTLSSFGDVAMVNNQLAINGMHAMDRAASMLDVRGNPEIHEGINVVANGFAGSIANRFGVEGMSAFSSRASHLMSTLNFFNKWNDTWQEVTAKTLSWWLGRQSNLGFDALPSGLRQQLSNARITAAEWDAMRKTAGPLDAGPLDPESKKFLLIDRMDQVDDAAVDRVIAGRGLTVSEANRRRVRDDLEFKLSTYYTQQVHSALNIPDLRTKYVVTGGGARAGTLPRSVFDLLMVFKSFPISVALRMKQRAEQAGLRAGKWGEQQWSYLWSQARLIGAATLAGYLSMSTKDLLNGKTRKRLLDDDGNPNLSVYFEAMQRGGALGIMGDVLFNEYDRQYKSVLGTFAGPALNILDPLGAAATGVRRMASGEETRDKPLSDAFNLAQNNLPFGNLFYVKPILNAFVWWNIKEALSPGILKRVEKHTRDLSYQDYYIEPSEIGEIPFSEPGRKIEAILGR